MTREAQKSSTGKHVHTCTRVHLHTYKHWGWRLRLGVHPALYLSMRSAASEQQRPSISASSGLRWKLHATTPRCCTWGLKFPAQGLMPEQQAFFWLIHLYRPPRTYLASENFQVHPDLLAHIQKKNHTAAREVYILQIFSGQEKKKTQSLQMWNSNVNWKYDKTDKTSRNS